MATAVFVTVVVATVVVVVSAGRVEALELVMETVAVVSAVSTVVEINVSVVWVVAVSVGVVAVTVVILTGFRVEVIVAPTVVTVPVHPTDVGYLELKQPLFVFVARSSIRCTSSASDSLAAGRLNERFDNRLAGRGGGGPPSAPS